MKHIKSSMTLATGLLIAGVAFAHHLPVPLSYSAGVDILSEVTVYMRPTDLGVPAYNVATSEHGHNVSLSNGDSFSVTDHLGNTETVVFDAQDFVDISNASDTEVANAINAQLSIGAVSRSNGYFAFRGVVGGPNVEMQLQEIAGQPLQAMNVSSGTTFGRDEIELTLSIPAGGGLENQRYVLLASATPGQFIRKGQTVPLAVDTTTRAFLAASVQGSIQGFRGRLDSNADATATVSVAQLEQMYGVGNVPNDLYFSFVVLADGSGDFDMASNLFTVHVVQ